MVTKARLKPRKQPTQERARETVDAILGAAARVLVRSGYEGANTNRIAEAAGVSVGSLYQYYPNKEALVAALIQRHLDEMWQLILERTRSVMAEPLPVATRHVIGAVFAAHAVEPRLHIVLREQVPRVGKLRMQNELTERCVALAQTYLELHKGDILPRDIPLAACTVVTIIDSLACAALERVESLAALQEETSAVVLRYLTGRAA